MSGAPAREVDERALVGALKNLRELIEQEYALEVERAAAVAPLAFQASSPSGGEGRRTYLFRTVGSSGLKSGDSVDIVSSSSSSSEGGSGRFGTLVAVSQGSAIVELGRSVMAADIPPTGLLRLHADDNQRTIRLRAVERVVRERHALHWIGSILTAADPAPLAETDWEPPADARLTDGQRRALVGAARSQDVCLIQGPPGTGKTTVIAALVRYFATERGVRVLLSSKGHRAIDNALDRLGTDDLHVLRLGQSERVTGAGQTVLLADVLAEANEAVPRRQRAAQAALGEMLRSLEAADRILAPLNRLHRELADLEGELAQREGEIEEAYESGLQAVRQQGLRVEGSRPGEARRGSADTDRRGKLFQPAQREQGPQVKAIQAGPSWKANGLPVSAVGEPSAESQAVGRGGSAAGRVLSLGRALGRVTRLIDRFRPPSRLAGTGQDRQTLYRDAESWVAERRRAQLSKPELLELRDEVADLQAARRQQMARAAVLLPQTEHAVGGVQVPPLAVGTPDETLASLEAVRVASASARAALPVVQSWGTWLERPGAVADVLVETADVVAATAIGVNSGRDGGLVAELEFDVAIVDEAGQAQLTDLVVPLSRARTVILVGDHQQLPPYVDDELLQRCMTQGLDTAWLTTSLFEQLWNHVPTTHRSRLDVQFRMPHAIADFLGRAFYGGELASAASRQGGQPVCELFGAPVVFIDTSLEVERGETAMSPGFVNRCEVGVVAEIARRLPSRCLSGEGLGVIAPYGAQVASVRQVLGDALGLAPREPWLVDNVATVDSFQGQERDVILVSLTRSNPAGAVGFLSDLKRLNVTLSRAREQLVVIGDLSTLCAPGGGPERRALAQFVGDLADHVREHGELVPLAEFRQRLESVADSAREDG